MTKVIVEVEVPDNVVEFRYIIDCIKMALNDAGLKWDGLSIRNIDK